VDRRELARDTTHLRGRPAAPVAGTARSPKSRASADRQTQMQNETLIDAVTAVIPVADEARPAGSRMHLTGTLRRHGEHYVLEQQLNLDTGAGPHWTTPRIRRLMATDATRAALHANVDRVVTISGTPGCGDTRNRTSIVLDSVQLFEAAPNHA
jgi:hypothetical protein